jgi:hypothetical protein
MQKNFGDASIRMPFSNVAPLVSGVTLQQFASLQYQDIALGCKQGGAIIREPPFL